MTNFPRFAGSPLRIRTQNTSTDTVRPARLSRKASAAASCIKLADPGASFSHRRGFEPGRQPTVPDDPPFEVHVGGVGAMPPLPDLPAPSTACADAFGMDTGELKAQSEATAKEFSACYRYARRREAAKAGNKNYQEIEISYRGAGGEAVTRVQRIRAKSTYAERLLVGQTKLGARAQTGLNRIGRSVRRLTGRPRKTGSGYASAKSTASLLNEKNQALVDGSSAVQAVAKGAAGSAAALEGDGIAVELGVANELLGLTAVPFVVSDAMGAADGIVGLRSRSAKAKADLGYCEPANALRTLLQNATPAEAEAYLLFGDAARRLVTPTREERAIQAVAEDVAAKNMAAQPLSAALTAAIQSASLITDTTGASLGLVPLSFLSAGLDLHQGKQEHVRRQQQKMAAHERKLAMKGVLDAYRNDKDIALLAGLVASLDGHQDRLIRQARREKRFAGLRMAKGVAGSATATGGAVVAGLVIGGLATAATAGAAAGAAAVPAAVMLGALAARAQYRAKAEHTSKWRQRAAHALSFSISRDVLEQKLAGTHSQGPELRVAMQEGDYLPESEHFARTREISFDARSNEYLGLQVLALRVQDVVLRRDYDAGSPFMALVHALGIGLVELLAICKAASIKPAAEQLDFIQARLAPAMGIKLRLNGKTQALPHVSVFLEQFEIACQTISGSDPVATPQAFWKRVREALVDQFADEKKGLAAFVAATSGFLEKVEQLSQPQNGQAGLVRRLKAFLACLPPDSNPSTFSESPPG